MRRLLCLFSVLVLLLSPVTPVGADDSDLLARAQRLNDEVVKLYQEGRYANAIPKAREALAFREQALGPTHPAVAQSLNNLAVLLMTTGDYEGARPLYERALTIREQALGPTHPDVAQSVNNLAGLLEAAGDYAGARPLYERALTIREQALGPTHPDVAQSLNNLAGLLEATGDYAGARPLYERALTIREQALGPTHPDVAVSLNTLADLLRATGDYAGARPLSERALTIREQALGATHPNVARSLNNLAGLLEATGDYAGARPLYERALTIREQALGPTHPGVALILNNLALLRARTGDYAGARPLYERALTIWEQALRPTHPNLAVSLNNLAAHLHTTGDYAGARPLYERALTIREQALGPTHPDVAVSLNTLAALLRATGDYAGARPLSERALTIREQALGPTHPDVAVSLNTLAALLRATGDYAGARPLSERALRIARARPLPETLWHSLRNVARVREQDGQLPDALGLYREAVAVLQQLATQFTEEPARTRYLAADNKLSVYDALAALLLKLHGQEPSRGYDREALTVIEAKKNRIVADALTRVRPTFQDPQVRAQIEGAQAPRDRMTALERALGTEQGKGPAEQSAERLTNLTTLLATTKKEYLDQVQPLLARYREHVSLFPDQQVIDPNVPAKFATRLLAGTLAVGFFPSKDELYLFVVASGGTFRVKSRAVSQAELFGLVREYRRLVAEGEKRVLPWEDDSSADYRTYVAPLKVVAARLGEHLLGPIEEELRAHTQLILMPNDLLLYLPFHALPRPAGDGTTRFLAETHVVSYLTQMEQAFLRARSEQVRNVPLLAMSNPDGTLGMASREVHALRGIRSAATVLDGPQATKAAFLGELGRLNGASDLHFATHGFLDTQKPERSYLLMAGPDVESRRLGIGEIRGLSLRTRLAVLSACETAVGEDTPGAALITLAAAFSQAGADTIVASLWKVEDEASKNLMVAFHRALAQTDLATALQAGQLAVMREARTAHPFYWAAFLLIGAR